ncbi:aminotransferase class IV [Anoxynatronum buryatiense]|uniref:Branched-chain amino acid aminotransferase n=1 Tax=Anoxynatronum buryatiense TaxID=489973 RepID=A0AA46AK29_9CLOT|nr:aminotransferase class IV [Anoxynatronum buryatiense]SMP67419.1 branched-chain amino acid aminotransferase [Anoxynatronum buryatiense]
MSHREIEKSFFLLNGHLHAVEEFDPHMAIRYPSVYEVIRVIDGVPLFWEAHLDRMQQSLALAGASFQLNRENLRSQMDLLIQKNQVLNHNLKVVVNHWDNTLSPDTYLFFITTRYPSDKDLHQGVPVILHPAERKNPNAKIISTSFRAPILKALESSGAYEALLVNQSDEVTEGSRSNFFVIKQNVFYTPPAAQVLQGITRQVVMRLVHRLGYQIQETSISRAFLLKGDALFLTGTSPGVLPISNANGHSFSVTLEPLQNLQGLYHHFVRTYVDIHRSSAD